MLWVSRNNDLLVRAFEVYVYETTVRIWLRNVVSFLTAKHWSHWKSTVRI